MSGIIDCEMHIGDEVFVHGYIDEIRNGTIIIRNVGGYFGTSRDEVFYYEDDGYGMMNAYRKTEPQTCENRECKNYDTINDHCMFIEQCHYEPKVAPTANPYKIVLEDLRQVPMFTGMFDAKNGNEHFMFGVLTVLEYIAGKAGNEEYSDMFLENMNKSVYGDKAVVK